MRHTRMRTSICGYLITLIFYDDRVHCYAGKGKMKSFTLSQENIEKECTDFPQEVIDELNELNFICGIKP